MELAQRAGLHDLVAEHVSPSGAGGANSVLKIPALVAGMVAGADSIDDMALLRHGAMSRLFTGVRAPSTLGTFLRRFTFGNVRQVDAVNSRLLVALCRLSPLLPGVGELAYIDVDDTMRQTYGYQKQGAGRGYTGVKGLNAGQRSRSRETAFTSRPKTQHVTAAGEPARPVHRLPLPRCVQCGTSRQADFRSTWTLSATTRFGDTVLPRFGLPPRCPADVCEAAIYLPAPAITSRPAATRSPCEVSM